MLPEAGCLCSRALWYLGAAVAVYITAWISYRLLRGLRIYLLSELWRKDLKSYGDWAVVTGATNGIGKAYAHELAKRGLNVVLISRSQELLENVAKDIEERYGQETKIIQVDFNKGPEIYERIQSGLRDINIGILVNNVGMNFAPSTFRFLDAPDIDEKIPNIINCNILSLTKMTQIVLPGMVERRRGVIVNISSEAGSHPHPLLTVYSSTKAYVNFFSKALHAEYKSKGVTVQCLAPLLVSTNMTPSMKPNLLVKRAEDFVREAVNTIGLATCANGCLSHSIQSFVFELLFPEWLRLTDFSINQILKMVEKKQI